MVSEESIGTNAKCLMAGNIIVHIIRREAGITVVGIDVVWEFGLIHNSLSEVTSPLNKVCHMMFRHKAVCSHMVTIDNDADVAGIVSISNWTINVVISTPEPGVVNDGTVSVDDYHGSDACWSNLLVIWATRSDVNIRHNAWLVSIALVFHDTPSEEDCRLNWTSFEEKTGDTDVVDVGNFNTWLSSGRYKRSHTNTEQDRALIVHFD